MIQELFGGNSVGIIGGERSKLSTPSCGGGGGGGGGGILDHGSPSPSPSASPSPSSSSTTAAAASSAESLRCPRCESSNTKFCYYNNYNLTQPRHFCKTCRRYWTKGGALRNVPIGGGCRKNKTTIITAASVAKSASKFKAAPPPDAALFGSLERADAALPSNPIMWATSSQNSHFLSLLRTNQTLNPSNLTAMKDDGPVFGSDHLGPAHLPSMGLSNPFYRNQTLASQGILHGEAQSNGLQLQELYHRLRLSSSNCYPEHTSVILGNMASSSSTSAAILESAPVAAPEMGFWNSNISWPTDLSTAYP